jgi:hypothetical protein
MEKVNIELKELPIISKIHNGITINIYPYISIENKLEIIKTYLDALFSDGSVTANYIMAEYSLILSVVNLCTNINIDHHDIITKIVFTGLWDEIKSDIKNYNDFRKELDEIIKIKRNDMSLSSNLNILILKISDFIDNISKLDLSENGIKQLTDSYKTLQDNVGELNKTLGNNNVVSKKRERSKKDVQ